MKISLNELRKLIRHLILETEDVDQKNDGKLLGEPDLSAEDERTSGDHEEPIDEFSTVSGGAIRGWMGPLGAGTEQWDTVGVPDTKKKKKKKKKKKRIYGW